MFKVTDKVYFSFNLSLFSVLGLYAWIASVAHKQSRVMPNVILQNMQTNQPGGQEISARKQHKITRMMAQVVKYFMDYFNAQDSFVLTYCVVFCLL